MKRIVFLCGISRAGKTSIANYFYKNYGYNVIKVDAIINAVNQLLEDKIDKQCYDERVKTIIISLLKNFWSDVENRGYKYMFDSCSISIQTALEIKELFKISDLEFIFFINSCSAKEMLARIRDNEKPYDWTLKLDDEKLLEFCNKCLDQSNNIKNLCILQNIKYIDISYKNISQIVKEVEELIK